MKTTMQVISSRSSCSLDQRDAASLTIFFAALSAFMVGINAMHLSIASLEWKKSQTPSDARIKILSVSKSIFFVVMSRNQNSLTRNMRNPQTVGHDITDRPRCG